MPVQQVHMHSWSLGRPEEGLDPPKLELPIMRVLGIDLESSEEQPVLLTAEPPPAWTVPLECQLEISKHGEIQPWACLRGCFQKQLLRNQDPPSKQVAQI